MQMYMLSKIDNRATRKVDFSDERMRYPVFDYDTFQIISERNILT